MNHRHVGVIATVICSLVVIILRLSGSGSAAAFTVLSIPFVLFFPGFSLMLALFPGGKLELAERVALSLGISLAVAALSGLILNWTGIGLNPNSWTVLLGLITLTGCAGAIMRWQEQFQQEAWNVPVRLRLVPDNLILLALAGFVTAGAFVVAIYSELTQARVPYTELWILPPDEELAANDVQIGFTSYEAGEASFRLVVEQNAEVILDEGPITLSPGESWTTSLNAVDIKPDAILGAYVYYLYQPLSLCDGENPPSECEQNDQIYRQVVLWNWDGSE